MTDYYQAPNSSPYPPGPMAGNLGTAGYGDSDRGAGVPPSAPDDTEEPFELVDMPEVPGYDQLFPSGGGSGASPFIQPPAYDEVFNSSASQAPAINAGVGHITVEEARAVLQEHVAQHCCYGKSAAQDMVIRDVTASSGLHYKLETFTEMRSTTWKYKPYIAGTPVDGPMNGAAPQPWDVPCNAACLFKDEKRVIEVPHTSHVIGCPKCLSSGFIRCSLCTGRGSSVCISCNGRGTREVLNHHHGSDSHHHHHHHHHHHEQCFSCNGTGHKRCFTCNGSGSVKCSYCQGHRYMRCFISLTVTFKNNVSQHVVERSAMNKSLISEAGGNVILDQSLPRVGPIREFYEREICDSSQRLVEQDSRRFTNARIIMQRQVLRIVPVSECSFTWKDKFGKFWVYGTDRRVEAPDYPQQCCCGCTIL